MSSPTPATQVPTRQQLDEIDALLRRMLTLPPMMGETAPPAPPAPQPQSDSFAAPVMQTYQGPIVGEPAVHSWRVEWPQAPAQPTPSPPSVVAWGSPVPASPPPESAPWVQNPPQYTPPPFATPVPSESQPQPAFQAPAYLPQPTIAPAPNRRGSTSTFMGLIVLLNGTFNVLTYLLGPLGKWLRGPGRTFIGWVGVAMLLTAIGWAVGDWQGIEWPRPDLSRLGLKR
jgi:hypothetical protein